MDCVNMIGLYNHVLQLAARFLGQIYTSTDSNQSHWCRMQSYLVVSADANGTNCENRNAWTWNCGRTARGWPTVA